MRASMLLFFGAVLLVPATAWAAESNSPAVELVVEGPDPNLAGDGEDASELAPESSPEGAVEAAVAPETESIAGTEALEPGLEEAPIDSAADDDGSALSPGDTPASHLGTESLAEDRVSDPDPVTAVESPEPAERVRAHLGALGYDSEGRPGRIHVVVPGDTLWDISDAYLGTPWVWPSIWEDNREIENPHVIQPGEHIWITPTEMRRVTAAEAERLMSASPAALQETDSGEILPAAEAPPEVPVALETAPAPLRVRPVSSREGVGLISAEALAGAASIVDAVTQRLMLSQGDQVYIGLGQGDTRAGDEFTIFRERDRVLDPDTRRLLGYHIDILGWVRVNTAYAETSRAEIRESAAPIERGDYLIPRELIPQEIEIAHSPTGVEGKLSYFARNRTMMAHVDYVYLNRGTLDGLEVGSPLEVYRRSHLEKEVARGAMVRLPGRVVAQLLVVKAEPETAVATVTHTDTELELGDLFRGATN